MATFWSPSLPKRVPALNLTLKFQSWTTTSSFSKRPSIDLLSGLLQPLPPSISPDHQPFRGLPLPLNPTRRRLPRSPSTSVTDTVLAPCLCPSSSWFSSNSQSHLPNLQPQNLSESCSPPSAPQKRKRSSVLTPPPCKLYPHVLPCFGQKRRPIPLVSDSLTGFAAALASRGTQRRFLKVRWPQGLPSQFLTQMKRHTL